MLLKPGTPAPPFTLPDAFGTKLSLIDFFGYRLVMWFFPKANTSGWTVEGQGFRDEFPEFERRAIQIVGVSADPPSIQEKFVEKNEFPFPMLCDEQHDMLKAYGVWGPQKMAGREYEGIHRVTYLIKEYGTVFKTYPKVNPRGHAGEILAVWD